MSLPELLTYIIVSGTLPSVSICLNETFILDQVQDRSLERMTMLQYGMNNPSPVDAPPLTPLAADSAQDRGTHCCLKITKAPHLLLLPAADTYRISTVQYWSCIVARPQPP